VHPWSWWDFYGAEVSDLGVGENFELALCVLFLLCFGMGRVLVLSLVGGMISFGMRGFETPFYARSFPQMSKDWGLVRFPLKETSGLKSIHPIFYVLFGRLMKWNLGIKRPFSTYLDDFRLFYRNQSKVQ